MPLEVNITNISQVTYPVDVYVCRDCPDIDCTLVDTISSVPATITIPGPYSGYSSFVVKIIDAANCEYCQTFQGTTTTSTTTLNPICQSCDIGFDFYDTNPIGVISVGSITASCDPSVTDYVIEWYGPGVGSTTVSFTSGYGTDYIGDYLYTHPLTGSSEVPIVAGIYTPVIQKIKLNGTEYTNLNCFNSTTVDVDALTCINGSGTTNTYYSHGFSFSATTSITPQPVVTTFALDPLKPYFAYSFKGEQIYDDLKITFFGSSYSDPIVLEYISMGTNQTTTDFSLSLTPKTIKNTNVSTFFPKVLCLTAITVNNGDYLEIEITPNPINNNTNWELLCECLETFNCELCYDTTIPPIKIIQSSIINQTYPCDGYKVEFTLSGCNDSDIYRYLNPVFGQIDGIQYNDSIVPFIYNTIPYPITTSVMYYNPIVECGAQYNETHTPNCDVPNTNTITYEKSVVLGEGLILMTFDTYSDLEHYKFAWDGMYISYSGNPTNPLDVDFYRFFNLRIPLATGSTQCGDLTGYENYNIHPSATITTGGTGPWTMSITMPTITNSLTWGSCDIGCSGFTNGIVNFVNDSSTGTTNDILFTSNTGSKLEHPFFRWRQLYVNNSVVTASTQAYQIQIPNYVNQTIPYSGSPLTIIPSLSAETCDLSNFNLVNSGGSTNLGSYTWYMAYYEFRITSFTGDFEIWSYDLSSNPIPSPPLNPLFKIYENIGGIPNVIDSSYFI